MISIKKQKFREEIAQSIQNFQTKEIKSVFKKQNASCSLEEGRTVESIEKTNKSLVINHNALDYNLLHSIVIKDSDFCEKQMSVACVEQDFIKEQTETTHRDFQDMCLNVSKQMGSDINFLFTLLSHFSGLTTILNSDGCDVKDLSDRCSVLVFQLYEKIEYLKKALQNVASNSYVKASEEFLQALCITDASDMFRKEKCDHALANIKILLEIQKRYLPFIVVDCMNSPQACNYLGYVSLYQHENLRAVEFFKKGISLSSNDSKGYYQYLQTVYLLLKANKCDQKSDQDLISFFNWVDKKYNANLSNNTNELCRRNSNSSASHT